MESGESPIPEEQQPQSPKKILPITDAPEGETSKDVVAKINKILKARGMAIDKNGHERLTEKPENATAFLAIITTNRKTLESTDFILECLYRGVSKESVADAFDKGIDMSNSSWDDIWSKIPNIMDTKESGKYAHIIAHGIYAKDNNPTSLFKEAIDRAETNHDKIVLRNTILTRPEIRDTVNLLKNQNGMGYDDILKILFEKGSIDDFNKLKPASRAGIVGELKDAGEAYKALGVNIVRGVKLFAEVEIEGGKTIATYITSGGKRIIDEAQLARLKLFKFKLSKSVVKLMAKFETGATDEEKIQLAFLMKEDYRKLLAILKTEVKHESDMYGKYTITPEQEEILLQEIALDKPDKYLDFVSIANELPAEISMPETRLNTLYLLKYGVKRSSIIDLYKNGPQRSAKESMDDIMNMFLSEKATDKEKAYLRGALLANFGVYTEDAIGNLANNAKQAFYNSPTDDLKYAWFWKVMDTLKEGERRTDAMKFLSENKDFLLEHRKKVADKIHPILALELGDLSTEEARKHLAWVLNDFCGFPPEKKLTAEMLKGARLLTKGEIVERAKIRLSNTSSKEMKNFEELDDLLEYAIPVVLPEKRFMFLMENLSKGNIFYRPTFTQGVHFRYAGPFYIDNGGFILIREGGVDLEGFAVHEAAHLYRDFSGMMSFKETEENLLNELNAYNIQFNLFHLAGIRETNVQRLANVYLHPCLRPKYIPKLATAIETIDYLNKNLNPFDVQKIILTSKSLNDLVKWSKIPAEELRETFKATEISSQI